MSGHRTIAELFAVPAVPAADTADGDEEFSHRRSARPGEAAGVLQRYRKRHKLAKLAADKLKEQH
jgi:hypothetical protein